MNKVKTIFIGTGEFAVPLLEAALAHPLLEVVAVITQPDRPAGRDQELKPPLTKQYLLDYNIQIEVLQPEKIKEISPEILEKYQPELILLAAYGQIISDEMLNYPKYKCLNFHGSLLPELRGAVPVPMAILQGLEKTGTTLQTMVQAMDAGDIVATREYVLKPEDTTETLMSELSKLGVEILNNDLAQWINGGITPQKQDESSATYCYKDDISKEKAEIKFETDVQLAERMIRAFYPWPIAWIENSKGRVKIFKAKVSDVQIQSLELKLFTQDKRLFLALKNGCLELLELQLEGKKRDEAKNYLYLV